jgi:hypothetical protein
VGADHCLASPRGTRRPEESLKPTPDFHQLGDRPIKVRHLLAHQVEDMKTRNSARPLDLDDCLDLIQVGAEPSSLGDEGEER